MNTHDQLTGLHNRRHFLQLLNDKIKHSKVSSEKFAVFYIDVDQFKIINDTCGHAAGDVFIKELAHELYEVFDRKWIFARLSSSEFGLIV